MKTVVFNCFVLALIIGGCTQEKSSKIEGAWKLVYNKTVYGNTPYYVFPNIDPTEGQIKMWTKDHVSFTGIIKWDSASTDNFGVGTYKLNGNQYEESYLYCSYSEFIGKTLKLTLEIKNDTLTQTSLEKDGKFDKSSYMIEKYVRL
jgi:hypothetical protein